MIEVIDYVPGTAVLDLEAADVHVLNRSGSRRPVVHVLTWDTEATDVPALLDALPEDQPVYVISPPTGDDPFDFPRTVTQWAAHVSDRLDELDLPDETSFIGWSFGGVVAAEVAQAHHDRAGRSSPVEVVMLDTQNPTWIRERTKAVSKAHAATRLLAEALERPRSDRLAFVRSRISDLRGDKAAGETRDEMSHLRRAILVSWFKYEPHTYTISAALLWCDDSRARVDDAALGWARWWDGRIRIERLGPAHFAVYEEPARSIVAAEIMRLGEPEL